MATPITDVQIVKGRNGSRLMGRLAGYSRGARGRVYALLAFPMAGHVEFDLTTGQPLDVRMKRQGWSLVPGALIALRGEALRRKVTSNRKWEREQYVKH